MRAKTINETNNFERGLDPKKAMGVGMRQKLEKIAEELEDSNFDFNCQIDDENGDLILTGLFTQTCDPEDFHNPITDSKNWRKRGVSDDFEETYTIIISLLNKTFIREYKFENTDIYNWEFIDKYEFEFTTDPTEIYDMIDDDINTFDVFAAEQSAWKATRKNGKEKIYKW